MRTRGGYGRIIRGGDGSFDRIVEQKDATEDELAIDEVNAGVYAFGVNALRDELANLTTENAHKNDLNGVIPDLRAAGYEVKARSVIESPERSPSVDDRAQLKNNRRASTISSYPRGHALNGVTIEDPATTQIDLAVPSMACCPMLAR